MDKDLCSGAGIVPYISAVQQTLLSGKLKRYFSRYQFNLGSFKESANQRSCPFCFEMNVTLLHVHVLSKKQVKRMNNKNLKFKKGHKFLSISCYTCEKTDFIPIGLSKLRIPNNKQDIVPDANAMLLDKEVSFNTKKENISSLNNSNRTPKSKNKSLSKLQQKLSSIKDNKQQGASLSDFLSL